MRGLIRFAFDQFYTTFAWTYDAVAAAVSFGEWQQWGRAAMLFLPRAGRLLEIAHGPGHLHVALRRAGYDVVGIDLSPQMSRMAHRRVLQAEEVPLLARASVLRLPFGDRSFACAVSTFPTEFVFAPETLSEVRRVLQPAGRFVIVPMARFTGRDALTGLLRLAYRATGQAETPADVARARFEAAGYAFAQHVVPTPRAEVIVWVCLTPAG